MMDLRVSVVLFFVFLTGGYSLRCYSCTLNMMGSCDEKKPETCPYGDYKCASGTGGLSVGSTEVTATYKGCLSRCKAGVQKLYGVSMSVQCCDNDLCNAPGYSLTCFSCKSDSKGVCDEKEETCPAGHTKCETSTGEITVGSTKVPSMTKRCSSNCKQGINYFGMTTTCCNTDFCNAANAAVYSLRCFSCRSDSKGVCDEKEETCPAGHYKCETSTGEITVGSTKVPSITKRCSSNCKPGINHYGMTTTCCDTDFCNAANAAVNPLRCYSCTPDSKGFCDEKEETCPAGNSKCETTTGEIPDGSTEVSVTSKGCASQCEPGINHNGMTTTCCDTDLCNAANAADGMYKGSFLLLFSPLLFYFLFQ